MFDFILLRSCLSVFVSRDDAVSSTVSTPVVVGKLSLAPHPVQNEGNCTWIRGVDVA